jgi:hypothetical protein
MRRLALGLLAVLALESLSTMQAQEWFRIPCPDCDSLDTWCWYYHMNEDHASPAMWEDSCMSENGIIPPTRPSACPQCNTVVMPDSAHCHDEPTSEPFWRREQ